MEEDEPATHQINPCWCCGMSLKRWSYIFAGFDIIVATLVLGGAGTVLVLGDLKISKAYPFEGFTIPREALFGTIFLTGYILLTGVLLVLSITCREPCGLYAWIILNFPFNFINFFKIFESVVVYKLAREIRKEEKLREDYFEKLRADEKASRALFSREKVF